MRADRKMSERTHITHAEYLQLAGLFALAERTVRQQDEILAAAVEITRELGLDGLRDDNGHTSDFLFGREGGVDGLIAMLGLGITPRAPTL